MLQTLKEKDRLVRKVYDKYRRAQLDLIYLRQHYNYYPKYDLFAVKEANTIPSDAGMLSNIHLKLELEDYLRTIDYIHTLLKEETYHFIEHEYLNHNDNWWMDYYSSSTYYRKKNKALNEIIEILLEMNVQKNLDFSRLE